MKALPYMPFAALLIIGGSCSTAGPSVPDDVAAPIEATPAEDGTFVDAAGTFHVPVPENWKMRQEAGGVVATDADETVEIYLVQADTDRAEDAVDAAWARWARTAPTVDRVDAAPGDDLWERSVVVRYERQTGRFVQAIGRVREGHTYVALITGELETLQKRGAQANVIIEGLRPTGVEELDLAGAIADLTAEELEQWKVFVAEQVEASQVPGAAVVLVRDGEVVWEQGFGMTHLGGDQKVTPSTPMMIGSTTKPLTTLVLAGLIDEGKLRWDQPVQEVVPRFRVKDPEVTKSVQVQHLACACTGVPRRDLELFFENRPKSAEDVVEQLQSFEFFTDFGETFQYSNQMVAMAGFTAAAANGSGWGELGSGYQEMMEQRLFEPLEMRATTLDFDKMTSSASAARPHLRNLDGAYVPLDIGEERFVVPVAPAGAIWSTAQDLGKLARVLLAEGKLPDGRPFVTPDALEKLWTPTVAISTTLSYGLGWFVEDHHGVRVVHHGGNNFGFTSSMTLVPGADVAIIVLSNGAAANHLGSMLDSRLLELLYDQPARAPETAKAGWARRAKSRASFAEKIGGPDLAHAQPFLGDWSNDVLGGLRLAERGGEIVADWGTMSARLGRAVEGPHAKSGYYLVEGPLKGLPLRLETVDGTPAVLLGEGAVEYEFTKVQR